MRLMAIETELAVKRKALALSQAGLARLLGVTQGTVSRNETADVPDARYKLALDALAAKKAAGESLAA